MLKTGYLRDGATIYERSFAIIRAEADLSRFDYLPALLETERAASQREASLTAALGAENARMTEMRKQAERLTAQPANPR